ncbi:MAG TPA: prepilin-type N-terminal cleavage/methylation domain-containing protein [Bryobacteraceae bacterium]|jgi:type II secretory pathway pseudopilin PulG|nr:prepilin-type N-terminal cleavage/methylation domain-containing protein [Bryobacteraceae bacterium]
MHAAVRKPSEAGVTLLELLIAVTLVSLLSVGMAFALRISLDGSKRAQDRIGANRRVLGVERILREQISNLLPVATACRANSEGVGQPLPFFEGLPGTMRLVSTYSLTEAGRGVPRVLEYQIIPGEDGAGVRLIVNELPWTGPEPRVSLCSGVGAGPDGLPYALFPPVVAGPKSFVLADKLASCHIEYREVRQPPELERWVDQWTGANEWPSAIRVKLVPLIKNSAELQPSSLTVPIAVNPDIQKAYNE